MFAEDAAVVQPPLAYGPVLPQLSIFLTLVSAPQHDYSVGHARLVTGTSRAAAPDASVKPAGPAHDSDVPAAATCSRPAARARRRLRQASAAG